MPGRSTRSLAGMSNRRCPQCGANLGWRAISTASAEKPTWGYVRARCANCGAMFKWFGHRLPVIIGITIPAIATLFGWWAFLREWLGTYAFYAVLAGYAVFVGYLFTRQRFEFLPPEGKHDS